MLKTSEKFSDSEVYSSADPLQLVARNRSDGGKQAHEFEHSHLTNLSAPHIFFVMFHGVIIPINENTLF